MNEYEKLLDEAYKNNIDVMEYDFDSERIKGLYCDGVIALNRNMDTSAEKSCILAEELGHHHTSFGNIIDMQDIQNIKQERQSRIWAYDSQIGLLGLIRAYKHHCQSRYEVAEYLDVTEEFLCDALEYYKSRYGEFATIDHYIIRFIPTLSIAELF